MYWEWSGSGVQEANSDIEEDNKRCAIQKPQMKNVEDREQIIDRMVNTIFIFNLQMSNNYRSARFGMQRSKDDVSCVLVESTIIFTQSLGVLTQSLEL